MAEVYDFSFKIVLVGDSGVGKSNILSRYINGKFSENTKSSTALDLGLKTAAIKNKLVNAQIFDTAGYVNCIYGGLTTAIYRRAVGAMLVYDITSKKTYDNIKLWLSQCQQNSDKDIVIMLVGNKLDMKHVREISAETAEQFCKVNRFLYVETSAKENENIEFAFEKLITNIYEKRLTKQEDEKLCELREVDIGKPIRTDVKNPCY